MADTKYMPSQQECDAFRMKAISILKDKLELRSFIPSLLKAPIDVIVKAKNDLIWEIKLFQQFKNLEGKTLRFEGYFVRYLSKTYSIPLRNSFKIAEETSV